MNHLPPCKATLARGDSMSVFRRLKTDFPCRPFLSARGKRGGHFGGRCSSNNQGVLK
jgi:hypothetical protein